MSSAAQTLTVYLVRHAEPAVPPGRRFLGHADPPLGPTGEDQARRLARRLAEHLADPVARDSVGSPVATGLDAAYSSDLRRCAQTAEILVAEWGPPVRLLPQFREIDTGAWEDLTFEEAARRYPAEYAARERDLIGHPFPSGESFRDLQARVVPAFQEVIEAGITAGHSRVLIVGHKGVNRVLLCHLLGLPLEMLFSIEQDYCALTILDIPAGGSGGESCTDGERLGAGPFGWEDI